MRVGADHEFHDEAFAKGWAERFVPTPDRMRLFDTIAAELRAVMPSGGVLVELGTGPVLYLLSPSYTVINPTPNETITDFIRKEEDTLNYLKELIVQNLTVYSVLLDVNSYFIEQNNFHLLARLREKDSGGRRYEIKFYTHSPRELMTPYKDKI